jgi:hypothetical protein
MKRFVCVIFGPLYSCCALAVAQTWYVRADGGAPTLCDGKTDAPFIGSTGGHCGIAHLMYLIPPNRDGNDVGRKPLIAGGDTVMVAAGSYQFGLPFNGGGWGSCSASWPWDCHSMPVPSGTAANPTRIIGAGSAVTTFWGSGGASFVVNLAGSSNVVIQGITITDHSNCVQNHTNPAVKCQPGGLWAATGISDTEGGTDTPQSSNVTLTDVVVRGMAKFGLLTGNINNWTLSNVKILANGFGGMSLDTGPSYSRGTNTFTNVEFSWNGCTENYPSTAIYACWGQMSGGYGDGLGSSSSSDRGVWSFQNVVASNNTQDGLDFLHADPSAVITFDHVNAYRNAGNQIKGNGSVTITNSTVNAYCSSLQGNGDMVGTNAGGGGTSGDLCRALGDAVVLGMSAGHTSTLQNNTVLSQGNCVITVPDSGVGDATSKIVVTNNILIGLPVWVDGNQTPPPQSCLYYWNSANVPSFSGNVIWKVKGGTAPAGNLYADPKLTNQTLAAFDPTPTSATPPNVGAIRGTVVVPPPPPAACVPIVSKCATVISGATAVTTCTAGCQ